ncbi:hypothetical protein [uncultured Methanobrevibacter sp.]|uniref:hypothetical protein n=1 Tax=uncultured Methanobrevibacter sp. TaxID=253161 RepID=UPI0025F604A8|nr:hypothetical protein [uncultured Methanobrevibacter sp.]
MSNEELGYEDVKVYEKLFTIAPAFVIERMLKKNHNFVSKFKPTIKAHLTSLNEEEKAKLDIIFKKDIEELQAIMKEAYIKTNKKQFKVLSDPKYKQAIKSNLDELKKMVQ